MSEYTHDNREHQADEGHLGQSEQQNETRERRDENTATDPNELNLLPDEVLVDGPTKLAHEDMPVRTLKEAEVDETRAGGDFEGAPSAAELRERRIEESEDN